MRVINSYSRSLFFFSRKNHSFSFPFFPFKGKKRKQREKEFWIGKIIKAKEKTSRKG
jgi:hypothetical protein